MERIKFSLSGGLSRDRIAVIHAAVLQVLEKTGIACAHEATVERVTAGEGIAYDGGRLRFSPDLVEATIERLRDRGRKRKPYTEVRVGAPFNHYNLIDMDTGEVRGSTAADVIPMLKLAASFYQSGPAPVYPCDLDSRLQILWLEKMCMELTSGFGGFVVTYDEDTIRWVGEMRAAAGRDYEVRLLSVISPLRLDHKALDLIWRFRGDPVIRVVPSFGMIPVGGITAPLSTSGLLAQGVAECLGEVIVGDRLGLLSADQPIGLRVDYGDMRHMTVAYSMPENVMIQVLLRDLSEHFLGYRSDDIYLNMNAKLPDAFAAVDRMAYMLMLGLAGFRDFWMGAGQMSMDEIFSPAQFIIDMEIARYVQRVMDGVTWEGSANDVAKTIAEGAAEGNFLTHPTTLEMLPHMFESPLFRRDNVDQWRAAGQPTTERLALERARQAIESYTYQPPRGAQADLDRIFEKACRALGVDVAAQSLPPRAC